MTAFGKPGRGGVRPGKQEKVELRYSAYAPHCEQRRRLRALCQAAAACVLRRYAPGAAPIERLNALLKAASDS